MPVPDGFFAGGLLVDGFEREGNFDEFFGHTGFLRGLVVWDSSGLRLLE